MENKNKCLGIPCAHCFDNTVPGNVKLIKHMHMVGVMGNMHSEWMDAVVNHQTVVYL